MTTSTPTRPWWQAESTAVRTEPFGALAYDFSDRRLAFLRQPDSPPLLSQFESGLNAPICLTWELTYACNLECAHCLSSSGRRDPRELTTEQCKAVIDELQRMKVFYVNIGGGEPTIRPDFWELLEYAVSHDVGVKFSTNGSQITPERARFLAATDYVDVQISLDGATAEVNDYVRGPGSYDTALRALFHLREAGFADAKISVVCTRHNIDQLDAFKALADEFGATLRLTRLRPSGRGADVWDELHPTAEQQRQLYDWLVARTKNGQREDVLTGDSFFHLSAYGEALPGLNLCGAGRVVCLIDPVGDVYACPFAIHDNFLAGNLLADGGFEQVWQQSSLFADLRAPQTGGACAKCSFYDSCRGGCMAAKFFTGLPLDGPDPECVQGYGEQALAELGAAGRQIPAPSQDHSRTAPTRNQPVMLKLLTRPPASACAESPLAGFVPTGDFMTLKFENPWKVNPWFESVAVAQQRARKRLPQPVYGALVAGSERGQSIDENEAAFRELGFAPHVAGQQPERSQTTTVLGHEISLPVVISPTGVQAVHPDGEVAVARAAAARGTLMGLSNFASRSIEDVTATGATTLFQMYWTGDRDQMIQR
ncbi:MAG: mycofactocin radical SAM maturase, partial [Nocardioidaceae bacterium]